MGFVEAVRTCLFRKYVDFRGRAARAEYWWFVLFTVLVRAVAASSGIWALGAAVGAVLALPRLAVTVRRLHDTNRSGWWALLSLTDLRPPGVGWQVAAAANIVLLVFMIRKGDAGENRYGSNPDPDLVLGLHGPPSRNAG